MGEPPHLTPTFITTPGGEELVVMSRQLFDQLASGIGAGSSTGKRRRRVRATDQHAGVSPSDRDALEGLLHDPVRARKARADVSEDAADADLAERARTDWIAAGRPVVPLAVVRHVRAGDSEVKAFRMHRGMRQIELAKAAGIAQGYLSDIERGRKAPNATVMAKLASALDTHPACLDAAIAR